MTTADKIRDLHDNGKSNGEIAKQLFDSSKSENYETFRKYVVKVVGKYRKEKDIKDKFHYEAEEEGQFVKGRSKLIDADGNVRLQWIKSDTRKEDYANNAKKAIAELVEELKTIPHEFPNIITKTKIESNDLLNLFPVADLHHGLLACQEECQRDSDTKIMSKRFIECMNFLCNNSPKAGEAHLVGLGDLMHSPDDSNMTPTNKHNLSVDTRNFLIVKSLFQILQQSVDILLQVYPKVTINMVDGNHHLNESVYIRAYLSAYYHNCNRVEVVDNPAMLQYRRFGRNLLGFTHGHTIKPERLKECIIVDNQAIWSDVYYRYIHTGHIHHNRLIDSGICRIESHQNLNTGDSYSVGAGYRQMYPYEAKCITYHREKGEISRMVYNNRSIEGF